LAGRNEWPTLDYPIFHVYVCEWGNNLHIILDVVDTNKDPHNIPGVGGNALIRVFNNCLGCSNDKISIWQTQYCTHDLHQITEVCVCVYVL
jgi:hypothetical protein